MSDISQLEGRITAALERIGNGVEALKAAPATPPVEDKSAELAALAEALESERTANAQLEERVKALHEKQQTKLAGLERQVAALSERADQSEAEAAHLKKVNAALRRANADLRAANAQGLGDAGAINAGLAAELEALRALREGDRAELDGIISEIAELVPAEEETRNA
ncbi:chromosome segregation ATPase [Rhodovulum iodosum]|uniref:Chromosome segregation ATPase n=1 Tax=Rhodovulum iodosum TaxID=68291 RepID=A0ABV3XVP1_9RHOB|nr:hypothetical protein [Rhodovulum robiginosum]RSK33411.1 hypothetical protein EJA01_08905 [Rhodovulum robiginosum]